MEGKALLLCRIPTLNLLNVLVQSAYQYNLQFRKDFPDTPRILSIAQYDSEIKKKLLILSKEDNSLLYEIEGFEDIVTIDRAIEEYDLLNKGKSNKKKIKLDCEDFASEYAAEETYFGKEARPLIIGIEEIDTKQKKLHAIVQYKNGLELDISRLAGMPACENIRRIF